MPTYTLESPDGRKIDIEAADEATALRGAQEWAKANPVKHGVGGLAKSYATGLAQAVAPMAENLFGMGETGPLGFIQRGAKLGEDVGRVAGNVFARGGAKSPAKPSIVPSRSPITAAVARNSYKPQTVGEEYAQTAGQMTPNVFAPGGVGARIANVALPAIFSETAGQVARASGAGQRGEGIARAVGAVGGAGAASIRAPNLFAPRAAPAPADILATRARLDPAAMRTRAGEMRAAGVQPTIADVAGEKGRRLIRAVGVKSEDGGEILSANARSVSSSAKPAIMARTEQVGPMRGKTADEVVAELFKARDEAATTNYAGAYATPVKLDENILRALSDEPGKAALRRARAAAVARMDEGRVKEIDSLLNHDGPLDMSQGARMARADEQGFRQDAYHGTTADVREFDLARAGSANDEGYLGKGVYLADEPQTASIYAGEYWNAEGGNVFPARVGQKNPLRLEAEVDEFGREIDRPLLVRRALGLPEDATAEQVTQAAQAKGHDGVIYHRKGKSEIVAFDPAQVRSRFDIFAPEGYRAPPEQVTAATLHRARIALRERGQSAKQRNANDLASGLNMRGEMIDKALENVPEMAPANADFRAKSQALNVLGQGKKGGRKDVFSTDPADYGRWMESLSPEARQANAVAIRQEVLDTLGGQRSSTFGTVDDLATSEYAKANLAHALGPEAGPYLAFLDAKLHQVRNARFIEPNAGSRTAVLENDIGEAGKRGMAIGGNLLTGNARGAVAGGVKWAAEAFMRRGVSKEQAEALARMAVDPAQTDAAIAQIAQRLAPRERQQLLEMRNAAVVGTVGATTTAPNRREQRQ